MNLPENHVVAEGRSLRAAIDTAAEKLGVPAALVEHKIDIAHFRSAQGTGIGSDTVKIYAWPRQNVPASPAVTDAEKWAKELLSGMGIQGQVRSAVNGSTISVQLDAGESAPFLVGKRGTTVRAIQYLLGESMRDRHPDALFQVDIAGGNRDDDRGPRRDDDRGERPREDRGPRRDDDRGPRRDDDRRPRRDDRGERPRDDRGPRRDDDRGPRRDDDRRDRRRRDDEEDLKKLARRLAQKVLETGEAQVIRRDLNAYDRRIVHLEASSIEGVRTRSIGEGLERRVEILPAGDGGENAEN